MVPSYSGVLCLVTWLIGFFQSFVPLASAIKLATVTGACFSKRVQRSLPAVVSITATGFPELAAAGAVRWVGAAFLAEVCAQTPYVNNTKAMIATVFVMPFSCD